MVNFPAGISFQVDTHFSLQVFWQVRSEQHTSPWGHLTCPGLQPHFGCCASGQQPALVNHLTTRNGEFSHGGVGCLATVGWG